MATIILPVFLCVIIILGFCLDFFRFKNARKSPVSLPEVLIENIYSRESLTLSLIGVAISVWIGLNIYNVISKEELKTLLDSAQVVAEATEQVYAEMLKSKFRMSASNTASEYFDIQLGNIGPLPVELSKKFLILEDLFQISYRLYGEGISAKDNPKGVFLASQLEEIAENYKKEGLLNNRQYQFLMGYASWRWGDFLYYQARYDKSKEVDHKQTALCAIEQYKQVGRWLFAIQNMADFHIFAFCSPENRGFLAYLANDIASTYIDVIKDLSGEELYEAITAEKKL